MTHVSAFLSKFSLNLSTEEVWPGFWFFQLPWVPNVHFSWNILLHSALKSWHNNLFLSGVTALKSKRDNVTKVCLFYWFQFPYVFKNTYKLINKIQYTLNCRHKIRYMYVCTLYIIESKIWTIKSKLIP